MSDSKRLFETATRLIPGGVNSPVRAFRGVGGEPFFVARGEGARIWDVDGRSYLDFLGSWGPFILGHAPTAVVEAISEAARRGTSYGAPTPLEVEMAEAITAAYPSIELVRLVSSGTEAAMSAIRVARGATGRPLLVKFDGCYHGHADSLLVKAGSGGATFSIPDSGGVPAPLAALTLSAPFNDLDALRALFRARGDEIAAVIVEPVAGNMGVVAPLPGFLEGLREITRAHGDRKSTRLNSSHSQISYAVFCLKKKKTHRSTIHLNSTHSARPDAVFFLYQLPRPAGRQRVVLILLGDACVSS